MANYISRLRTNYFSVMDEEKFRAVISSCLAADEIHIFDKKHNDGSTKFAFYCYGRLYGLPTEGVDLADDEGDLDAFHESLQTLIPDKEAIIITEIGFEAIRCLVGSCTVITRNDIRWVNLREKSLELARNMLGNAGYDTQTEY